MATIQGHVRDVLGRSCVGAHVYLLNGGGGPETYTDNDGNYVFADVAIGEYSVNCDFRGTGFVLHASVTTADAVVTINFLIKTVLMLSRTIGGSTTPASSIYPETALLWVPTPQLDILVVADSGYSARYYIIDDGNPIALNPLLQSQIVTIDTGPMRHSVDVVFSPSNTPVGVLQGIITDITDGNAINGVVVTIDGQSTMTDWRRAENSDDPSDWVLGFYKFLAVPSFEPNGGGQ